MGRDVLAGAAPGGHLLGWLDFGLLGMEWGVWVGERGGRGGGLEGEGGWRGMGREGGERWDG